MQEPTRSAIRKEADRVSRAVQVREKTAPHGAQAVALNAGVKP
ncbi:MAG TPA: pilus assembly protein TadD, partial [Cupriavidus sp.]|nr:pilus assembly protein TadD [Cupriavidus sp.]